MQGCPHGGNLASLSGPFGKHWSLFLLFTSCVYLISVHVGAGAARRVLQRGAGPAGDLLSPGPGPPLKAPPLQCQFSSQTCFDPSATHTSQLYSKTPPEQRTTQSKSARSIFKFKNASSIALFYPRLPNACFSKQNITKDHIFIL